MKEPMFDWRDVSGDEVSLCFVNKHLIGETRSMSKKVGKETRVVGRRAVALIGETPSVKRYETDKEARHLLEERFKIWLDGIGYTE